MLNVFNTKKQNTLLYLNIKKTNTRFATVASFEKAKTTENIKRYLLSSSIILIYIYYSYCSLLLLGLSSDGILTCYQIP